MIKKKILNVLYQSNDGYSAISGASIVSLLDNNQLMDEVNVYYLGYEISNENIQRFNDIVSRYKNGKFYLIDATKYHRQLKDLGVTPWRGLYITWMKLLAVKDLNINTDRVLYLNSHTIINSSLEGIVDLDMENNILGMAYDCLVNSHKEVIGLDPNDGYFNCGIMLFNYRQWIDENIDKKVRNSLKKKSDYLIADQDFCNIMFNKRIKLLDSTYNYSSAYYGYDLKKLLKASELWNVDYFYSYDDLMSKYYSPKIIHSLFGVTGKPWEIGSRHPQRYLWQNYLHMTPWRPEDMPSAKYNINWLLYDTLPSSLLLRAYKIAVVGKYGKKTRNRLIVFIMNNFTSQKGT